MASEASALTKRSISSSMLACVEALEVADERLGAAVELLVEAVDDVLVEDAEVASTRSWGSAAATSQCVGEASSHSTG